MRTSLFRRKCLHRESAFIRAKSDLAGHYRSLISASKSARAHESDKNSREGLKGWHLLFRAVYINFLCIPTFAWITVCPRFVIRHLLMFFYSLSSTSLVFFVRALLMHCTLVPKWSHQHISQSVCHVGNTFIFRTLNAHGVSIGVRISPHSANYQMCSKSFIRVFSGDAKVQMADVLSSIHPLS